MGWIILAAVVMTVGLLQFVMDSMWKRVVEVSVTGLLLACVGGLAAVLWRWSVARRVVQRG